jgi:hypothetical protein
MLLDGLEKRLIETDICLRQVGHRSDQALIGRRVQFLRPGQQVGVRWSRIVVVEADLFPSLGLHAGQGAVFQKRQPAEPQLPVKGRRDDGGIRPVTQQGDDDSLLVAGYFQANPVRNERELLEEQLETVPTEGLIGRDPHPVSDQILLARRGLMNPAGPVLKSQEILGRHDGTEGGLQRHRMGKNHPLTALVDLGSDNRLGLGRQHVGPGLGDEGLLDSHWHPFPL